MTRLVPVRRPFLALDARRRDRRPGARAKLSVRVEPLEGRTLMSTVQDFEAPGTPSAPAQLGHGGPDWMPVAGVWNEGATTRAEAPTSPGTWGPVLPWPAVAIHAHLLPTGQVLYWDRAGGSYRWDPAADVTTPVTPATPGYDTFCSGHAFLPDGRLLVAGGHDDVTGHFHADFVGVPDASLFDPATNSWTRLPDMNAGRWYPTATTLASGEVLVLSGTVTPGVLDTLPQVLTTAGTWRDLTGAQAAAPLGVDLYPRLFVAPDGRVFKAGPDQDTWFLDTAGTGSWTPGPPSHFGLRTYGSAVMYEPGKILIAGGGDPPTATAEVIDLNEPNPAWHSVSPMAFPRRQHNATLLPDGTVLVTGGSSGPGHSNEATPVLPAELWNPATGTWTTLAAEQIPRLYHSTALLLPDGRVLSAGGGQPGTNHPDAEIFSPPDLAQGQGSRPTIASAPATVAYGEAFAVATPDAARIAQVSLIRLGSVTHAFDENQRYLRLGFTPTPGGLIVTAPAGPNLAPPGHYMLFLLDGDGVPSVAQILRIDPPPTPSAVAPIATAPADPINPVAGGGHDAAAPPTAGDGPEARPGPTETVPAAVDAVLPRIRVPKRIHRGKAHRHHQVPPRRRPMHGPGPTAEPRRRVGTAVTGAIRSRRRATPRPGP